MNALANLPKYLKHKYKVIVALSKNFAKLL
jgi:hypothetical protein